MGPLELVNLSPLMARTRGRPEIPVGLIDGPVDLRHPGLGPGPVRTLPPGQDGGCRRHDSAACLHGTFVAGMLSGDRARAAGVCPDCTLLVRPLFPEVTAGEGQPAATAAELAGAIRDCLRAGARVINLSLAVAQPRWLGERELADSLDQAMQQGTLIVAAAGNEGTVGGSPITNHPWVIPVVACDAAGRPLNRTNLGSSIGRNGLRAPGQAITGLGAGATITAGGTSVAAPFVAGAAALLWSEYRRPARPRSNAP
jgi:subtilisin family serine protease